MRQKHIIVIGGVKHSGKSTLGRLLADLQGAGFADTDTLLEKLYSGQTGEKAVCREIFRELGEESFRRLEADAITDFAANASGRWVVALGGGAAANPFIPWQELPFLRLMTDVPAETVQKRILASDIPPFLGRNIEEFESMFPEWFSLRRKSCLEWAETVFVPDPETSPAENARNLFLELKEKR